MFFSRLLCVAGAFSRNNYALGHHNSAEIQKWPGTVITFLDRVLGRSKSENDRQKCSNSPENETECRQTAQENEPSERLRSLSARRVVSTVLRQTLTASDGNEYLVTVTYDNTSGIPSDAELYVSEIKEGEAGYEEYVAQSAAALGEKPENLAFARAFDITLKNPRTGEEYQPNKNVAVTIELLKDDLNSYASVDVIHIPDGAGREAEVMDSTVHGESVEFETDGFSVYVLTGSGGEDVPMWTYTFYTWNETLGIYQPFGKEQFVKNGEAPVTPQPANTTTLEFAGWYYDPDPTNPTLDTNTPTLADSDTLYDFDQIHTFTEDGGTSLYAKYTNYAYVIFHDQYDANSSTWPVAYTRSAKLTGDPAFATIEIGDLSVSYNGSSNLTFLGWSDTPVTTPGVYRDPDTLAEYAISSDTISVDGEKHLYPIFKSIHWLTYYTAQSGLRAAYVPTEYIFDGEGKSSPLPTTSREGYEFLGWYTGSLVTTTEGGKTVETVSYGKKVTDATGALFDESSQPYLTEPDGGVYVSSGRLRLSADATLYAKWRANYYVIIWKQSPTDPVDDDDTNNHYEYFTTITNTAEIGESVSFNSNTVSYDHYEYFYDDGPKTIANTEEITVLNAYYKLTEAFSPSGSFTLSFADSVQGTGASDMPHAYDGTDGYEKIAYGTALSTISVIPPIDRSSNGHVTYTFKGWYMDQACTLPIDATDIKDLTTSTMTMPDHDLRLYAGWEPEWFLVQIDTNYGALYYYDSGELKGDGSTWFWQTYDDEPIGEYTHTSRDYVESSSGSYYYVNKDRAYYGYSDEWNSIESGKEKKTYYTQNISEATEDTTFEYSPDTYSYIGWYEVYADGSEAAEPYDFTKHTDHNTTLRLHWRKNGIFYLGFNSGEGDLDDNGTKTVILPDGYSDYASITLTRSAAAPAGYTFVGWRMRGEAADRTFTIGQEFTLHADDAVRESGKDIVWLDAVYVAEDAVTIVYNANGGSLISDAMDYGKKPSTTQGGEPIPVSGSIDEDSGTVTVTGLTNNSSFILSSGAGFSLNGSTPVGWSTSPVYNPKTDTRINCGGIYGVDTIGGNTTTLYAIWPVTVTYHLNKEGDSTANWGDGWSTQTYQYDSEETTYSQTTYIGWNASAERFIGRPVAQPVGIPTSDQHMFYYWATRSGEGTTESPYEYTPYDFSQPVTAALDLYAYWDGEIAVPIHAVDATAASLTVESGWVEQDAALSVGKDPVDLTTAPDSVTLPSADYTYAFAVALSEAPTRENVFESNAVSSIYYNQAERHLYVTYVDTTKAETSLKEGTEIYFIYYQKKSLDIGYKSMDSAGVLNDIAIDSNAPTTTGTSESKLLGTYDMTTNVNQPMYWAGSTTYSCYAFAIGDENAPNASRLKITTATSTGDSNLPQFRVQNSWEGFRYSTDNGSTWTKLDLYTAQLYVVYFEQQPTIVMIHEETVGTEAVMDTAFEYHIVITQTVKDLSSDTETTTQVYDSDDNGGSVDLYQLKSGEKQTAVIFYSNDSTTEITQTITVTQKDTAASANFTTKVGAAQTKVWSYTSTAAGGTQEVTFTNTHKSLPVEVHVALLDHGEIILKDSEYRNTTDSSNYSFDVSLGDSVAFLSVLPSETIFTGPTETYALGAILYGTDNGGIVTSAGMGVSAIAYQHVNGNIYELLLDGDKNQPLGEYSIYYLYYTIPQIMYMKASGDTLVNVQGSTDGSTTIDTITYNWQPVQINQVMVEQGQKLALPVNSVRVISQSGNNFRMPGNLDDGIYSRYLTYFALGAGNADQSSLEDIAYSEGQMLYLRLTEHALEYSFSGDENDYTAFSSTGTPTIYAIYQERGYDLLLTKTIDISASGANPLFTGATFTVTISSPAIIRSSYEATGYESATIPADPVNHTITLTNVVDGMGVRIKGLGQGEYTITETGKENYVLTAKKGTIVSGATEVADVVDLPDGSGSQVALTLNSETRLDLTNTPQRLCKIVDGGTEHVFYTFDDAITYVEDNIVNLTATIEMLSDYLIPAQDALEIPYGAHITLTTASTGTYQYTGSSETGAVITRGNNLAAAPVVSNTGSLSMTLVNIDGANLAASAPLIQSSGDLTVGTGATLCNANSTGNGGAIYATDGDVTIDNGTIQDNEAASGAALFYIGSGTVSMLNDVKISGNTASGDGGAIYAAQGEIIISGTAALQNNTAGGNGGAIHAGNIIIEIDQNAQITGNEAQNGGAIYADTATITVSETSGVNPPSITGNRATGGSGGAIHVGAGTITVSGGSISGNEATSGNGGAVWAHTASVDVSDTASFSTNKALNGGAIYSQSGTVTVSGGSMSKNEATAGHGGAIYNSTGNVVLSDGSQTENKASGDGGAVWAGSGSVTVFSTVQGNSAQNGGAVYANTGAVTISGATIGGTEAGKGNTASVNGGAIYAGSGNVTVTSDSALTGNMAATDGGAIYANVGAVSVTGGSMSNNRASSGKGGAVYAASGTVGLSSVEVRTNTSGNDGGAVYAGTGAVTLTDCTTVTGNKATGNGGVVCTGGLDNDGDPFGGSVIVTGCAIGGADAASANEAKNGGAIYTGAGSVSVTDGSMTGNKAISGNGGAIGTMSGNVTLSNAPMSGNWANVNGGAFFADSGMVNISGSGSLTGNTAANGGAFYMGSGSASLTGITVTGNTTTNGSAIFVNTGSATFTAGKITGNTATNGGALGVGDPLAKLYISGDIQIKNNTIAGSSDIANIYLDQDADNVININGIGTATGTEIGIYVPNKMITVDGQSVDVYSLRGVPGAVFAAYTSTNENNITSARVKNDRNPDFLVQKDTEAKLLYWGNAISIEVRYLADYTNGFPAAGTQVKQYNANYYPKINDGAISELAADIYTSLDSTAQGKITATAAYGGAYLAANFTDSSFSDSSYVTKIKWDSENSKWTLEKYDGTMVELGSQKLIIYYAEPAYISIENNTEMPLNIDALAVGVKSVINPATEAGETIAGYGMTYAKNGAIRSGLFPITAADLELAVNASVTLLIPGGRNLVYNLNGVFITTTGGSVALRTGVERSLTSNTLTVADDGTFTPSPISGTTTAGTYHIIFGTDKNVCKVIDKYGEEHVFSKISLAISFITENSALFEANGSTGQKATIELLMDYLLPASDPVDIPRGYDITIKSSETRPDDAAEGTYWYTPTPEKLAAGESRATLSRDSENSESMVRATRLYGDGKLDNTHLTVSDLIIDGKSVRGSSDGGAVQAKFCTSVNVNNVDFKNIYAGNGGALYVVCEENGDVSSHKQSNGSYIVDTIKGTSLTVASSNFVGCNATKASGSRLGGGAIHTSMETFTLTDCEFESCYGADQAGAVFHRVDKNMVSTTTISDCTFTNCRAKAAGGLELDSKTITVTNTHFTNCVATERNGGGFNAYMLNSANPNTDSWITLTGCTFTNCTAKNRGGGFRSTGKNTKVENSTFTNCSAETDGGGGIGISSTNAMKAEIYGCTIIGCSATNTIGGGIFYAGKDISIGDYTYTDDEGVEQTKHTSITGCVAKKEGGGICYNKDAGSFTMTNAVVVGNKTTGSTGGGLHVKANNVWITGGTISNNTSVNQGGGLYSNAHVQMTISGTEITKNTSTNNSGGGVWYDGADDTSREKMPLTVQGCTINGNSASNGNGGGVYTQVKTVTIGDDDSGKHTSISDNTSKNEGGGLYHNRNVDGAKLEITNASIDGNKVTNSGKAGGGIYTNVQTLTVTGGSVSNNTATSHGGGIWYDGNSMDNRSTKSLTLSGCAVDGNTSGGSGGGIYTQVKTVTIGCDTAGTNASISNNTAASNGGGLYHYVVFKENNVNVFIEGSELQISGAKINGNTANNGAGGGVYTKALKTQIIDTEVKNNTSVGTSGGGGIYVASWDKGSDGEYLYLGTALSNTMTLTVQGCTFERNTAGGSGGGIHTNAKTLTVGDGTIGGDTVHTRIAGCEATYSGGGIYHNRWLADASTSVTNCTIKDCVANGTRERERDGGGGIHSNAGSITLTGSTIQGNTAARYGGGVYYDFNGTGSSFSVGTSTGGLTVDSCTMTGNKASMGGAVYTRAYMRLRNGSSITDNLLSTGTAENAAGVYLENNRTLVIGMEAYKDSHEADTVVVRGNKTNGGLPSNLRLWSNSDGQNNQASVYVYCNLTRESEVRVVNANKVGTWFGSSAIENPIGFTEGFTEDFSVFRADYDTLHGVVDRSESSFQHIIWSGPAVCKITDGAGTLLYLRKSSAGTGSDPAIFDRLDNDNETDTSIMSAFSVLRAETPELYYADGTQYYGPDYCVKMLDSFTTESPIIINRYSGKDGSGTTQVRNITLTTAGRNDADYPYEYNKTVKTKGNTATVLRGTGVRDTCLVNTNANLSIENIILDGGSLNGITAQSKNCILNMNQAGITVTLKSGATLQNNTTNGNGGGVYVNQGTFVIGDDSTGGVIRNCQSAKSGGAVCVAVYEAASVEFKRGNILQCTAGENGGGICLRDSAGGTLTMTGGSIERCTADNAGGGVYVGNNRAFHMSGTSSRIANNSAGVKGGGIAIGGSNSKIYFSVMPTVTGNTCGADADSHTCNVELDQKTTNVIQTETKNWNGRTYDGLINGAYIGVYVAGTEGTGSCYDDHGVEGKPFGTYAEGNNTKTFYSFVNDRNGLKGGLMAGTSGRNIYWVKIFSLEVKKIGNNLPSDEVFTFIVRLEGDATVAGQPCAKDIDGEYGNMEFHSDGVSSTTATVTLILGEGDSWEDGVNCIAENLSAGLRYTVTEKLSEDQAKKYASLPVQFKGVIGENNQTGVNVPESERYISRTHFENVLAVCKLTDNYGNLLYYKRSGAKADEAHIPAVYSSIQDAVTALNGTLYSGVSHNASSYGVTGGVKLQMLVGSYTLPGAVTFPTSVPIVFTSASSGDAQFPYRGEQGTVSVITKGDFTGSSMFTVNGNLTVVGITLDGKKSTSPDAVDGGILYVYGSLTVSNNALLQNSRVSGKGGAIYVAPGRKLTMTGGTIQQCEALYGGAVYVESPAVPAEPPSDQKNMILSGGIIQNNKVNKTGTTGNGAGIYLATGSTLGLSGAPSFGTSTTYGAISSTQGNIAGTLTAKKNGNVNYPVEHQDIYLEETGDTPASIDIIGNLTGQEGSIWIWAASDKHYKTMTPFAMIDTTKVSITDANRDTVSEMFKVFRNALPDDVSGNPISQTPKYLYGMLKSGDNEYVYWYGNEGSAHVMLVKVQQSGDSYKALSGKTFTVYMDGGTNVAKGTRLNDSGEEIAVTLENLPSGAGGAFFIGELPYGTYYVIESGVTGYFEITIDEGGVVRITDPTTNPKTTVPVKTVNLST